MPGTVDTENNFILSENGSQNLEQSAEANETDELERGLREGGAANEGKDREEGSEEIDLDELDDDRTAKVDDEIQEAHTPEERQRIRDERKQARIDRRNRAREREASLRREVASEREQRLALERRIAGLENNQIGVELGQLEQAEQNVERAIASLQDSIAEATVKADGRTVALATTRLQEALVYKRDLAAAKVRAEQLARTPKQPHIDPVLVDKSRAWASRNKWYKGPMSNDPDSKVLTAIDNSLGAENWDPRTDEYWEELEARAKKYLPHRMNGRATPPENTDNSRTNNTAQTPRTPPRQAVAGSGNNGNGSSSGGNGRTMILSAERVKAMKESGAWEDPVRRKDMIRRYREIDARNNS